MCDLKGCAAASINRCLVFSVWAYLPLTFQSMSTSDDPALSDGDPPLLDGDSPDDGAHVEAQEAEHVPPDDGAHVEAQEVEPGVDGMTQFCST